MALAMQLDTRPVILTLNLPSFPDAAVVEIQDFLYEILEHFTTFYSHQTVRFYEGHSCHNLVHLNPTFRLPDDDQPF